MKKLLALALAAVLALSMAGCGKSEKVSQGTGSVDENGNVIAGTTIDGAGGEVNLDALPGDTLTAVKGENKSKATIGDYVVSIEDAKIYDNNDQKCLVVTFEFKNNHEELRAFDNVMMVEAKQNGSEIMPAVIMGVEGINILSAVELIEKGDKTMVQKTYALTDLEAPVEVTVYEYGNSAGTMISKTFNLK